MDPPRVGAGKPVRAIAFLDPSFRGREDARRLRIGGTESPACMGGALNRWMLTFGLLALAGCGGSAPPRQGPATADGAPVLRGTSSLPSIYGLLGHRERLALESDQVVMLDSIARRLSAANDSLRHQLREAWGGDRPRTGAALQRGRPFLERISENNQGAGQLIQQLLNEDQRRIACEIAEEERAREERRQGPAPPPWMRGDRRRVGRDTVPSVLLRSGWPWCAVPLPAPVRR